MRLRQLFEAAPAQKVIAVMPGGFHPFHPGHKSLYDWAVETFGQDNVYVAATNDTKSRPFPFDVKIKLAQMAGVPANRFIQVKSPFNALSYNDIISDASQTALVFVRSEKDKTSHPLPDQVRKSDGNMGYLISYNDGELETADTHGYLAYGPTIDFDFSGMSIKSASELRAAWPEMSDEDKLQAAELMYPGNAQTATQLLNKALGDPEAPVSENVTEQDVNKAYKTYVQLKRFENQMAVSKASSDYTMSLGNSSQKLKADIAKLEKQYPQFIKMYADRVQKSKASMAQASTGLAQRIKDFDESIGSDINFPGFDSDEEKEKKKKKKKQSLLAKLKNLVGIDEDASEDEEDEFHRKLDKLVHKTFGHSSDEKKMKEKAPPGREDQVKALKKEFPDDEGAPYAIAWAQHNKKKKKTNESDVVIDKARLRDYLRMLIDDAIDKEEDINKLSKVLKMLVGKEIRTRSDHKFTITSEDVVEACKNRRMKKRG